MIGQDADIPRSDPDPKLGAVIRQAREDRSLRREDVAARAGITIATLGKLERGEADPSWSTVRGVAGALELPLWTLVKRAEGA